MSDDLVKRLRTHSQVAHAAAAWGFAGEGFVMEKAADRIEQLEAELQSLSHPPQTETRAALERAINASYAGDVPNLAQGVLFNLEMDGWRLVRKGSQENDG